MKDGVIVQIGTPEEIVTNPADEYVADFVAGISRLKLVFAHTVMVPIEQYKAAGGNSLERSPRAGEDSDLDHLIDVAAETDEPIVIVDGDQREIGVVDKQHLLRGIQGGKG